MFFQVIYVVLSTLLLVFGLCSNALIIRFFRKKGELHKTGFDAVLVDSIWALILFNWMMFVTTIPILFPMDLSYEFVYWNVIAFNLSRYNLVTSTFATTLTKLLYIWHPEIMLGTSDKRIYRSSLVLRLALMILVFCLNYLKPFHEVPPPPIEFKMLLDDKEEYQR